MAGPPVRILLVAALREELKAVLPAMRGARPERIGALACRAGELGGAAVVVATTGIGPVSAGGRVRELVSALGPSLIVSTGFAGGLVADLATGEIVVASEVIEAGDTASPEGRPDPVWKAPPGLLEAAPRARRAPVACVAAIAATPEAKRDLASRTGAVAVDMESAAIASAAAHVPLAIARVVLDDVGFRIPWDFGEMLRPDGRLRPIRALREIARHPSGVLRVAELVRRTRRAVAGLRAWIPGAIEAWGKAIRASPHAPGGA